MRSAEKEDIAAQAKAFLNTLHQTNERHSAVIADDLLLFFYRLRDEYRIIRSTSDRFKGPSFSFLHELLYQLESKPDETMLSTEWRAFIEVLLSDIASGRIVAANK
jgi:hypothetical protein